MASRLATLTCLLLLVAAPASEATLLERWAQPSQEVSPTAGGNETLHRLGDVDGDGRDEVLRVRHTAGGLLAAAVGGPALDREAWRLDLPGKAFLGMVPDQDGDGRGDLLTGATTGEGSGSGQGVLVAYAGTNAYHVEMRMESRAAADGAVVGTFTDTFSNDATYAGAFPLVASAFAYRDDYRANTTVFLEGQRLRLGSDFAGTAAWTSVGAVERYEGTVSVTAVDASGRATGSASFGGDRAIVSGGLGDVDGDGLVDVAVLESMRPTPVDASAAMTVGVDRLTAVSGRDASVLWQVEEPLTVQPTYRYVELLVLGDLDGDGSGELGLHEYTDGGFRLQVRSGTDGSVLLEEAGEAFAMPWGDVDGDGRAEYLRVAWGEGLLLSARGLDGDDRWSHRTEEFAEPVVEHYEDLLLGRWTDWTQDGVPDLLLAAEDLMLLDGADGEVVFRREAGGVHGIREVADLTGDGGPDLLLTRLTDEDGDPASSDDSNVTLRLEVLRGHDGAVAWSARDGSVPGGLRAHGHGIGDVDGDGAEDLLVELTQGCCEYECSADACMAVPMEDGEAPAERDEPEGWRVIHSGRDGRVLWRDGVAAAEAERGRPEPVVEPGAAFAGATPSVGTEVPVPAWTLVLALLAVLWVRRR